MSYAPFTKNNEPVKIYKGTTFAYQFNFEENGSNLDLTTLDKIEVTFEKSNKQIFLHSTDGSDPDADATLTISGADNNQLIGKASAETMDIGLRSYRMKARFYFSDSDEEVYIDFLAKIVEGENQTPHEFDIVIDTDAETVSGEQLTGLTALAIDAKEQAEGYANNLNRAGISAGDAGKIERVKGDESGWETIDEKDLRPDHWSVNSAYPREKVSIDGGITVNPRQQKPLITIGIDDTPEEAYTWLYPEFQARSLTGAVVGVQTDFIGSAGRLTEGEIKELHNYGWEMASHSLGGDGSSLLNLSGDERDQRLRDSWEALSDLGVEPRSFVVPGGADDADLRDRIRKYYMAADGGVTYNATYNTPPFDTHNLQRYSMDNNTEADIKAEIDKAIANNGWIILIVHPSYSQYDQQSNKDRIEAILDYIVTKGIEDVTYKEAIQKSGNILDIGDKKKDSTGWPDFGQKYLRVGGDGSLCSPDLGDLELTPDNYYSFSDGIEDFPRGKVSITNLGGAASSPFGAGVLTTYRPWGTELFYAYQKHIERNSGDVYYRYWDTNNDQWSDFELYNKGEFHTEDTNNITGGFHGFNSGISYDPFTGGPSGFPTGAGILITIKIGVSQQTRQIVYDYQGIKKWTRYWTGSDWSGWELVSGGATGSFTASSGETVTVENGLITDIS